MTTISNRRTAQPHRAGGRNSAINTHQTLNAIPSGDRRIPILQSAGRPKRRTAPELDSPAQRLPKRRCTRPEKPILRLFTRDFKFALPLAPTQRERTAPGPVADEATTNALGQCVDLALRLLEEGRGNKVLVDVGKQIVAERRAAAAWAGGGGGDGRSVGGGAGIYKGDLGDMPMWVGRFLRQVREVGIPIVVCDSLSGYGLTQRWTWGTDMENYDCRNSAIVYIHQCLVDALLESASHVEKYIREQKILNAEINQDTRNVFDNHSTRTKLDYLVQSQAQAQINFERAIFSISVFLAHEYVHCFTGFLTGSSHPGTPPGLNASPYSDHEHGEAGWYWTRHTFGGLGHVWCCKGEPAGPGIFGVPTLLQFNKRQSQSFVYEVDHEVVRSIIGVDWTAANSIDPNWFLKLRDEATRTPFQEWNAAYEEIVARNITIGNDILHEMYFGMHDLVKFIWTVLGPRLSWISRISLRKILSPTTLGSSIRYSSRVSPPTVSSISRVRKWAQKRIGRDKR